MFGSNEGVTTLQTLTTTLIDSINGYRDAAGNLEGGPIQQLFGDMATERSKVVDDLRAEITRLGGTAPDDGSTLGTIHQRFLDLKAAVTGRDEKAIINEVERGEDYLKGKFTAALSADGGLTPETRPVVERAFESVRKGHDQVSQIKHSFEA
ncbi:MAG TPA: PA2169 family four-helix-bundle protein [Sphingomicrobium sp.]|nr:PA2169 family four-helix-bundle protein [Sphingomicrobium sp.]